jgi:hypothetical protein
LPAKKWVQCFLKRHPEFSLRKANPIKRARAAVSREIIQEFFVHYAETVEGVPPENIYNCDETNFKDDPGLSKCIVKKGTKYVEKVQNTSKQATSVMLCGTAAKEWLPPMVSTVPVLFFIIFDGFYAFFHPILDSDPDPDPKHRLPDPDPHGSGTFCQIRIQNSRFWIRIRVRVQNWMEKCIKTIKK